MIVEAGTVCAVPEPVRMSKAVIEPAKTLRCAEKLATESGPNTTAIVQD